MTNSRRPRKWRLFLRQYFCSVCHAGDRRVAHPVSILGALLFGNFAILLIFVLAEFKVLNADSISITFEYTPYRLLNYCYFLLLRKFSL